MPTLIQMGFELQYKGGLSIYQRPMLNWTNLALASGTCSLLYYTYNRIGGRRADLNEQDQQMSIHQILQKVMKTVAKYPEPYKRLQPTESDNTLRRHGYQQGGQKTSLIEKIVQPYQYIFGTGGKKLRIAMAVVISQMFMRDLSSEEDNKKIIEIGTLIELLHCASLIIDDIEDQSLKRRDQPCAHLVYGINNCINAANFMYFLPFKKLLQFGTGSPQNSASESYTLDQKFQLIHIYIEQMLVCHLGQAEDLLMHKLPCKIEPENLRQLADSLPTVQQYFRMTQAKTGALLRMMVKMIGVVLDIGDQNTTALQEVVTNIGISFQITDDVLNLTNLMGKGQLAEDLYEKKFTLIINELKYNYQFMKLFLKERRQKTEPDIQKMIQLINQTPAIQKSKKVAQEYAEKAIRGIEKINCRRTKSHFIKLVKFMVQRDR